MDQNQEQKLQKYQYDLKTDDQLGEICRSGLERGDLWQPDVRVKQSEAGFFWWYDAEDDAPTSAGPFTTARDAYVDAIESEGVADPKAWGLLETRKVPGRALGELYQLWDQLRDVPVSEDDQSLDAPFLHFEKGAEKEDVWHWFESQNPRFVVGDVMQGIRITDDDRNLAQDRQVGFEEWPYGATVKLEFDSPRGVGEVGWAKRGPKGELLTAYGLRPLDASCWQVIEDKHLDLRAIAEWVRVNHKRSFTHENTATQQVWIEKYLAQQSANKEATDSRKLEVPAQTATATRQWADICANQGWNEESQIVHLEGFITDQGLMEKFVAYAERAAAEENQMSDSPSLDM